MTVRERFETLMVRRRASAVSNHEATVGPSSFETPPCGSLRHEGLGVT